MVVLVAFLWWGGGGGAVIFCAPRAVSHRVASCCERQHRQQNFKFCGVKSCWCKSFVL